VWRLNGKCADSIDALCYTPQDRFPARSLAAQYYFTYFLIGGCGLGIGHWQTWIILPEENR
jgi:hypothetical protein